MEHVRPWVLAALSLVATTPASAQPQTCTAFAQTLFVRDTLDELYLWYRERPDVEPSRDTTPEAYLEAARYRPLDRTFSYVTSRAASDAFFSESQFIGLGFSSTLTNGELRLLQVFDGSPAGEAGLDRGTRVLAIDGSTVAGLIESGRIDVALGPAVAGFEVVLDVETRDGERRTVTLRKRVVTIPTVSLTRVFEVEGRRVGYLFFRNFVRPSVAALDNAFAALAAARVDELVLDLRYNGGGLVDVAVHLGSLIGGSAVRDQVFAESRHNDRNRRLNETMRFGAPQHALALRRVVVIATRASASASELLINGLRPFVPVVIVGERTFGKPVGQYPLPFCDKVFAPVAFATVNADGRGDYFDGLVPDCAAPDDVSHELGDRHEASLAEALRYLSSGRCRGGTSGAQRASRAVDSVSSGERDGWRQLVNAH